jgi:soluble lytic murein transglycosylase-like protein
MRWQPYILEASARFDMPQEWIRQVMRAESGGHRFRHGRPIVSRAGAMGLMQLMPATWRDMRSIYGLGDDPHDPRDNFIAGTAYLRAMHDRFGYPGLFAAYNAGPARFERHLASGHPLPAETRAYVKRIARGPVGLEPQTQSGKMERRLFYLNLGGPAPRPAAPEIAHPPGQSLFVALDGQ